MHRAVLIVVSVMGMMALPVRAQSLGIGDPAPKLQIDQWIKGEPVQIEPGKDRRVFVVEFWATWCPPCVQSIPHMTELQKAYAPRGVVVVSITDEPAPLVKDFVKRMGDKMDYRVAIDADRKTSAAYMLASGQMGIPTSYVIDKQGRIVWIGSPFEIDRVLGEVVEGTFDVEKALADEKFLKERQMELLMALQTGDWDKCLEIGKEIANPGKPMSSMLRSDVLNVVAWQMLTNERADKKYFKEALQLAHSAFEACGCDDPSVLETYARALYHNGRYQEAVEQQRRAVDLAPPGNMREELRDSLRRYEEAARNGAG